MEQYKIILKLKPGDKKINEHLKRFDFAAGAQSTDNVEVAEVPPFEPGEANIHTQIGIIFYEQAVYLEAVDEFRLALANEEDKELRLVIAKIYELFGRMDKAITEVEAYRKVGDGEESVDILLNLARLYGLNKEMKKSIVLLKKAVAMDPDNDRFYHALALAHMSLNENEEAYRNINKAIKLNDKKDTYYFEQGALLERLGQYRQGHCQHEADSGNQSASFQCAQLHRVYLRDEGRRSRQGSESPGAGVEYSAPERIFSGQPGMDLSQKRRAEASLDDTLKKPWCMPSPIPVLYDHLGDVHFSMENVTEARKAWKTSLALTLKRLEDPSGEIPDPDKLREKIRKADQLMLQSF